MTHDYLSISSRWAFHTLSFHHLFLTRDSANLFDKREAHPQNSRTWYGVVFETVFETRKIFSLSLASNTIFSLLYKNHVSFEWTLIENRQY